MKIIRPSVIDDATLVSSSVAETPPAAYDAAVTYALGAQVNDLVNHRIYESLQATNLNHPLTDSAWWLDLGPNNRWKMFDQTSTSKSESADVIEVVLAPADRVDSVALFGVEAANIQVMVEAEGSQVYNEVFSMTSASGVSSWYDYFYEPIVRKNDLILTDMLRHLNTTITVIITNAGDTARVGTLVIGSSRELGMTLLGMSAGIMDYSRKQTDDFGNFQIVERAYSKKLDARVLVENTDTDDVIALLSLYRATALVWLGADRFASTGVFGFYKNFTVTFEYPEQSLCLLEIEGLT